MEIIILILFLVFLFLAFRCYKNKDFKWFGFYMVMILLDYLFTWLLFIAFYGYYVKDLLNIN